MGTGGCKVRTIGASTSAVHMVAKVIVILIVIVIVIVEYYI